VLLELKVKNLALIDDIHINFKEGFTAITGETGSGKSLLVNSLLLLLGKRAESHWVRGNEKMALIEGIFLIKKRPKIVSRLKKAGFSFDDEIILRRIIYPDGKSRAYLNDSPVTLRLLQELISDLIEIQGQRETLKLLNPAEHLDALDKFAGLTTLKNHYQEIFQRYKKLMKEKEQEERKKQERERRIDYLSYQIKEIEEAKLSSDEEETLKEKRDLLRNIENVKHAVEKSIYLLDEASPSICDMLRETIGSLEQFSDFVSDLKEQVKKINEALVILDESLTALRRLSFSLEADPEELERIEERLDLISRLKRKYGSTIKEILEYLNEIKKEHENLLKIKEEKEKLEDELKTVSNLLWQAAKELSEKRKESSKVFVEKIKGILDELFIHGCEFKINWNTKEIPAQDGIDEIEFLVSPNPGEEPKPLRKIASGGEISRVTLAIRSLLSDIEEVPIMVLDEVDSGIGGVTAKKVGRLLRKLGDDRQIICVTHLPQVACWAHHQICVEKKIENAKAITAIRELSNAERERELLRMMGGKDLLKGTRNGKN